MLADYVGLLVIGALGALLVGVLLGLNRLFGTREVAAPTDEPFATDEKPATAPDQERAAKFALVAILFVLLQVAAMFLYPWATVFSELSWFAYGAIVVFALPLAVGLIYQWLKGGLEW